MNLTDFPIVRVVGFTKTQVPEIIKDPFPEIPHTDLTPMVRGAYESPELQAYLNSLPSYVGRTVSPRDIMPPWDRHPVFKWTFLIPNTQYRVTFFDNPDDINLNPRKSGLYLMSDDPSFGRLSKEPIPVSVGVFSFGILDYVPAYEPALH